MLWLFAPIAILQGIYAKYYGLSLTTIATVVLVARLFDAITDPLIGYYSDRYSSRNGTRKPFILAGGLLLIISSYFLYVPFAIETESLINGSIPEVPRVSVAYFTGWFLLFYLAYTLFDIPHNAWASELAPDAVDKSKIYSFRSVAGYLGLILFYSIPLMPLFESTEITPETLKVSVVLANIMLMLFLYLCLKATPNQSSRVYCNQKESGASASQSEAPQQKLYKSLFGNASLLYLYGAYLFLGIGNGLWYGLIFLYVDSYLNMGEQFSRIFLLAFLVGVAVTPIWYRLSVTLGKRAILQLGLVLLICSYLYSGVLTPDGTSFLELLLLKVINTLGFVSLGIFFPAILSEIIDYTNWKYRNKNAGVYFSFYLFAGKISGAIGSALGLVIIGWSGYDATASAQNSEATTGLILSVTWLPSIFAVFALVLIAINPINAHRHHIVRRRMNSLAFRTDV